MIGIIGGTGLYSIDGLQIEENRTIETPFGNPSAPVVIGELSGRKIAFLPRHGVHHQILPSEINYRANLWALKTAGARKIVSISATGSLVEEIAPGDLAVPNQYLDWTRGKRVSSYFGNGIVGHISTAEPACPALTQQIKESAERIGTQIHFQKAYACVEGPRLGTRVESFTLRNAGCHLVGMTNVPEVFLARELQLCYCTIAVATDYDCWKDDPSQHVTLEKVMELYGKSLDRIRSILTQLIQSGEPQKKCQCGKSLENAVLTHASALSNEHKKILAFMKS